MKYCIKICKEHMSRLADEHALDLRDARLEVLRGHLHLGARGLDGLLYRRDVRIDLPTRPDHAQRLNLEETG